METVDHTQSNRTIAAMLKRDALARAAYTWHRSSRDDEADLALDAVLHDTGTLSEDEAILEIFTEHNSVVVVLEPGTEAVCVDIATGNTTRGALE